MKDGLTINSHGDKYWYYNGQYHREDGPAVEYANEDYTNVNKLWYVHGKLHREDGPAIEYASGIKYWCYHGEHIKCSSQEEFERLIKLKAFW